MMPRVNSRGHQFRPLAIALFLAMGIQSGENVGPAFGERITELAQRWAREYVGLKNRWTIMAGKLSGNKTTDYLQDVLKGTGPCFTTIWDKSYVSLPLFRRRKLVSFPWWVFKIPGQLFRPYSTYFDASRQWMWWNHNFTSWARQIPRIFPWSGECLKFPDISLTAKVKLIFQVFHV